jgi:hypothetical protein
MNTFLEFYVALLKFINYKLYTDLGLKYPTEYYAKDQNSIYLDVVKVQEL